MSDLPVAFTTAKTAAAQKPLPAPGSDRDPAKLRGVAQELESVFLAQMMETMFEGIRTDGPFGGGHGESVYRSLLLQEYSKVIAKHGGIGLADAVTRQLIGTQETNR